MTVVGVVVRGNLTCGSSRYVQRRIEQIYLRLFEKGSRFFFWALGRHGHGYWRRHYPGRIRGRRHRGHRPVAEGGIGAVQGPIWV